MKKCGCVRPPDYGRTRSESSDETQDPLRFRTSSTENVSWTIKSEDDQKKGKKNAHTFSHFQAVYMIKKLQPGFFRIKPHQDDDTVESFKDTQSQSGCSEESRNETNSVVTSTLSQGPDEETQYLVQEANLNKLGNLTTADVNHLRFLQSYLGSLIQKAEVRSHNALLLFKHPLTILVTRSMKQKEQSTDGGAKRKGSRNGDEHRQSAPPDSVGDWLCPSCGNINYGFRSACNMRKCGAPRPQNKQLCQIPHENNQNGGVKYVSKISSSQSGNSASPRNKLI